MLKQIVASAITAFLIAGGYAIVASGKPAVAPMPRAPVVLELFTSQGCSSCPPADALISRLAREPGILAISRPVTYWDRLGWRDTLARAGNTALQRAYVARGVGDQVFTPQVVVQGQTSAIGSDERAIRRLIANANSGVSVSVTAMTADRGGLILQLNGNSGPAAEIKLVTLLRNVAVRIGNGENGGRSILYTNVVSKEDVIGTWQGGARQIPLPANRAALAGGERQAILVQQRGSGAIMGALLLP